MYELVRQFKENEKILIRTIDGLEKTGEFYGCNTSDGTVTITVLDFSKGIGNETKEHWTFAIRHISTIASVVDND